MKLCERRLLRDLCGNPKNYGIIKHSKQDFHYPRNAVIIDFHLAELYNVETKALNQGVKRNLRRFPDDFMFQLNAKEWAALKNEIAISNAESDAVKSLTINSQGGMRSQIVTASKRNKSLLPYVFTEQGVAMLSSVLKSERAIDVNIAIMRSFVILR